MTSPGLAIDYDPVTLNILLGLYLGNQKAELVQTGQEYSIRALVVLFHAVNLLTPLTLTQISCSVVSWQPYMGIKFQTSHNPNLAAD